MFVQAFALLSCREGTENGQLRRAGKGWLKTSETFVSCPLLLCNTLPKPRECRGHSGDRQRLAERAIGIEAAWPWAEHADLIAAYTHLGLSEGIKTSLAHYEAMGKRIEWRRLDVMLFQRVFLNAA